MAIADESGEVKAIDFDSGVVAGVGNGHSSACGSVAVSPDSKLIVSGDENGCLFLWNL